MAGTKFTTERLSATLVVEIDDGDLRQHKDLSAELEGRIIEGEAQLRERDALLAERSRRLDQLESSDREKASRIARLEASCRAKATQLISLEEKLLELKAAPGRHREGRSGAPGLCAAPPAPEPVGRAVMGDAPLVSIVIPLCDGVEYTRNCLEAIARNTPGALFEVVLVDDASTDGTAQLLASLEGDVYVLRNTERRGLLEACNQGASAARGKYLVFLDCHSAPQESWLTALVHAAELDPQVGAVGARLIRPDGTLEEAGGLVLADGSRRSFGQGGEAFAAVHDRACRVDFCSGAALLVRRPIFERLGGFDGGIGRSYCDVDLAFGLRALGHHVAYCPRAIVVHYPPAKGSAAEADEISSRERFREKWHDELRWQEAASPESGGCPATADRDERRKGMAERLPTLPIGILLEPPFPTFDGEPRALSILHAVRRAGELGCKVTLIGSKKAKQEKPEEAVPENKAPPMLAPSRETWDALFAGRAIRATPEPRVDVVIPVYRGRDETLRCLYSVLSAVCETPHSVVVVDDESPDHELSAELRSLAETGAIELLRNERNSGFVASCNRGMALHPDRDVVLLNSDTEVYGDWLDRLRAAALREPRTGSVTPLSNNAEICSYPHFARNNEMALEIGYADLDRAAAVVNAGCAVSLPTAIGFCMYVRRACLDEVGLFDLERFGRGYGEENDFSLRASEAGWNHLLACNVFVRHTGGVSFGAEKQARIEKALARIHERFPYYGALVQRFLEADPVREARSRLDLARLARRARADAMLFVTHTWGGGVERHVQDLSRALEEEGVPVFFLRPDPANPHRATLSHAEVSPTPNLGSFDLRGGTEPLVAALQQLRVRHVHVHSLAGYGTQAADGIRLLARRLGVAYDFTLHDYASVCPRIHLIDANGFYCGEPDGEGCERCVRANGSPFGNIPIQPWREAYHRLLRGARTVLAPSEDVAQRMRRYFPDLTPRVQAHMEARKHRPAKPVRRRVAEPLRVAIIGALGAHKGYAVVLACARDARQRKLPIRFHLVGYSPDDGALAESGNVSITGRYEEGALQDVLAQQRCHCAFFPASWPETYSYTLSAAIEAGLYPVAFDLGAISERLRKLGWGAVISLGTPAAIINDALIRMAITPVPDWKIVRAQFPRFSSVVRDYYRLGGEASATWSPARSAALTRAVAS